MVSPSSTLAIILGASAWPKCAEILPASTAFSKSAQEVKYYLTGSDGMALPIANVLDLFDTEDSPTIILDRIGTFLKERKAASAASGRDQPRDLVLYYTGHGGFTGPDKTYFLAVRTTKGGEEGGSSIRMVDLATNLKKWALDLRRYIILDCCFSAVAHKEFQSAISQAIAVQTLDALPSRGTALLCSSSPRTVSVANDGFGYTMFSGALLQVLRVGEPGEAANGFSLEQTGTRVRKLIQERHADEGVRPEVHSPDEHQGDIADIPLFPNKALSGATWRAIGDLSQRVEEIQRRASARADESKNIRRLSLPPGLLVAYIIAGALAAFGAGTIYFATKNQLQRKFNTQNCLATHDILIETCRSQIDEMTMKIDFILKELQVTTEPGKLSALNHEVEELRDNRHQLEAQKEQANISKSSCYYADDPTRPGAGGR